MTTYSVFKEEEKYGLRYIFYDINKVVLKPIYTSLHIIDEDIDLQSLVTAEEWKRIDNFLVGIGEYTNYAIVESDGKQGLISWGEILIEFHYERIIKLSWRHYLCKKDTTYVLYDHFGYDSDKYPVTIELLATVTIQGDLTLTTLMKALSKNYPEAHAKLQECLYKDLAKGAFISRYRGWDGRLGSHCISLPAANQKVLIDDDFKTTFLKLTILDLEF
jgi:hypothetical protein